MNTTPATTIADSTASASSHTPAAAPSAPTGAAPAKPVKAAKPAAKAAPKAAKAVASAKPRKAAPKPAKVSPPVVAKPAKKPAEPLAKSAPKKVVKASAKPAVKPVAKPTTKPVTKTVPVAAAVKAQPAAPKQRKPGKVAKAKLVRDSFTMPQADFDLLDVLKQRALNFRHSAKKGELLRAGLQALANLSDVQLQAALARVTPLKPGRPKKAD